MTINIVLITHQNLGDTLISTAQTTLSNQLNYVHVVPVNYGDDPTIILKQLHEMMDNNEHEKYLFLTDLIGATPCNIAQQLLDQYSEDRLSVVTGLNLPMLLKVINYIELPLAELTQKAIQGGKEGVSLCHCHNKN